MKLRLEFTIEFTSDWHINAGYGAGSKLDAVLERDQHQRPVINGTTLKGLFRDALHDIARNLDSNNPPDLTAILGKPGQDSPWRFSSAHPAKSARLSLTATGVRVDPRKRRAEDFKYFARELGAAQNYTFTVEGTVAGDDFKPTDDPGIALDRAACLVAAASYIQRLGGRRRRGTGACSIRLSNAALDEALLNVFGNRYCHETNVVEDDALLEALMPAHNTTFVPSEAEVTLSHRYRILLYAERPLVIAKKPESGNLYESQSFITGQTLRGALAGRIDPNSLSTDLYTAFKQLFVLGGLKLSHLQRLQPDADCETDYYPTAALPLGLQRIQGDDYNCTSVFQEVTEEKGFDQTVQLRNSTPSHKFSKANLSTETRPHVAINAALKRASDGDLYAYEAIPAGTWFVGECYLTDENWSALGGLLQANPNEPFTIHLGKGRNRGYGECQILFEPMDIDDPPTWIHLPLATRLTATQPHELFITLASDAIIQDTWGRFFSKFDPSWLASEFGVAVTIETSTPDKPTQVVRTTLVESFDARSGLPRWRDRALVAGSTARLTFPNGRPSLDVLKTIEREGIGLRRGEGYGRVVFNHPAHRGEWNGFASALSLPDAMMPKVVKRSVDERFAEQWSTILEDVLFNQSAAQAPEEIRRALARWLVECSGRSAADILDEIQKLAANEKASDKKSSKQRDRLLNNAIVPLLQKLVEDGVETRYTRRAIVLLAERLLNMEAT